MATLAEIVKAGKGKAGHWRVESTDHDDTYTLYHYSTAMLSWCKSDKDSEVFIIHAKIGNGSVSDQNGMNVAFEILGVSDRFYYSRNGGPAFLDPRDTDDLKRMPRARR